MASAQQKLVLLGGCGCLGKSSLMARFVSNEFIHERLTTIGKTVYSYIK